MKLPEVVKLVEVGARDGLQNEPGLITTDEKVELINRLSTSGLPVIEVGSFVSPRNVPQMADTGRVFARIQKHQGVSYPVLVPNMKGMEAALEAGVSEVACFVAASETFSEKNINCSVTESLERLSEVVSVARAHDVRVRGYVSCVAGCPYEGNVPVDSVVSLSESLIKLGCYEVSLGDTIGVATAGQAQSIVSAVASSVPVDMLAVHFHDTYGQALANVLASLEVGIRVVDSSVAGLGGCPFAPGATGNVATEDVVYMLNGLGINTQVDLDSLIDAGNYVCEMLNRSNGSKVSRARASSTSCVDVIGAVRR